MNLSEKSYSDLLARARSLGSKAVERFNGLVAAGKNESEIISELLDIAAPKGKPQGRYRRFSDIPNDVLAESLTNPRPKID